MSDKFLNEARTGELWQAVKDYTIPTKSITKAEYKSLSEEEKMADVQYIITDDNDEGTSGGGTSQEIYSTEEIRIGTWIDGKPLYRKTYVTTTPSSQSGVVATLDTNAFVVNIFGCIKRDDKSYRNLILVGGSGGPVTMYANTTVDNNVVTFDCNIDAYRSKKMYLTVEYTKTTG